MVSATFDNRFPVSQPTDDARCRLSFRSGLFHSANDGFPVYGRNQCGTNRTGRLSFTTQYQLSVITDSNSEVTEHG
jgi:hypothetical protein